MITFIFFVFTTFLLFFLFWLGISLVYIVYTWVAPLCFLMKFSYLNKINKNSELILIVLPQVNELN